MTVFLNISFGLGIKRLLTLQFQLKLCYNLFLEVICLLDIPST